MENAPRVLREDRDGVATLTLNRPDKLNAIDIPLMVALREELDRLATDDDVRCVVLTGAGKAFCAGHDLESIKEGHRAPSKHFESETVDALEGLPMPSIAKIRGHCYTGGLEVALGCDLLVAAEDAKLGDTHGQWGLVPIWGMSIRLPERVGRSKAKELMFTSRRISGVQASEIGLVDRAVPEAELDATVDALTAEIAANSAGTNRIVKRLLATAEDRGRRSDSLLIERTLPYGMPKDSGDRMRNTSNKKRG